MSAHDSREIREGGGNPFWPHVQEQFDQVERMAKQGSNLREGAYLCPLQDWEARNIHSSWPAWLPERDVDDPACYPSSPDDIIGKDPADHTGTADDIRMLGNAHFKAGNFSQAVAKYEKCRLFLDKVVVTDGEGAWDTNMIACAQACRISCASNAAACHLKLGSPDACIRACDDALALDPANVKAMFRKGSALRSKGEWSASECTLKQAVQLAPTDNLIQQELVQVMRGRKLADKEAKVVFTKMFGKGGSGKVKEQEKPLRNSERCADAEGAC